MASGTLNLTISNTNIDETLTDFPVVVVLTSSNASELFAELGANKLKLKVFDETETTQRYVEIEFWDDTAETATLHVKVPSVSNSAETVLKLQYDSSFADNTTYVGVTGSTAAQNVWDANFVGVWHMAQDPSGGAGAILESTSNGIDATSSGSMTSGDLVSGLVGDAIDFDGTDDYLYTPDASDALDITSTITLETVINPDSLIEALSTSGFYGLVSRQETPDLVDSYALGINNGGELQFGTSGGNIQGTKNSWAASTDFYAAGTYQSSGLTGDLYVNGAAEVLTTDNYGTMAGGANSLSIGKHRSQAGDYFPGVIDEVRISDIVRSAAWIKATYYSLFDTLITITDVTTASPTTVASTTIVPTTIAPTTIAPTTLEPTTLEPTTLEPTTIAPTTLEPTTIAPTTLTPTTIAPTTVAPTTLTPTTLTPTTTLTTPPPTTPPPAVPTADLLRGLILTAQEIASMTDWPTALIEDYISLLEGVIIIADSIDDESSRKIEQTPTSFVDGSIPFAYNKRLVSNSSDFFWDRVNKILKVDDTILNNATASRLLATDSTKKEVSVSNLADWITGTSNKITVNNDGDGTVTITIPSAFVPNAIAGTINELAVADDGDGTVTLSGAGSDETFNTVTAIQAGGAGGIGFQYKTRSVTSNGGIITVGAESDWTDV